MSIKIDLDKAQRHLDWLKTMLYLDTISNNASKRLIKRGEVYKCNLGIGIGSEEGKERPCVIVQSNNGNYKSPNTLVAPITHSSSDLPVVVKLTDKFDSNDSIILDGHALLGNIVCVSKARLGDYICTLTKDEMNKIDIAMSISLDLKKNYDKLNNINNDNLNYIEKLKQKNSDYDAYICVLEEIKSLLNTSNIEELPKKIKDILNK